MRWAALLLLVAATSLTGCLRPDHLDPYAVPHPVAILRAAPYEALIVRVEYVEGAAPTRSALDHLLAVLGDVTDKSSIVLDGPHRMAEAEFLPPGFVDGDAGLLAIRYLPGAGRLNESHAGVYLYGHIEVYPDSWREYNGVLALTAGAQAETLEAEVLVHEAGHAMGLVNHGAPMQRARIADDDPCECHSANSGSVMTPALHGLEGHLMDIVSNGRVAPIGFDADDLADLAAYREGRTGPPL